MTAGLVKIWRMRRVIYGEYFWRCDHPGGLTDPVIGGVAFSVISTVPVSLSILIQQLLKLSSN